MTKIFDCITFFNENFITNMRFEILKEVIDCFIVCESIFDHRGNKKKINFKLDNESFKDKVIHLIHNKPFKNQNDIWKNQAEQREYIFNALNKADKNDYIMFSDPDEIPNPEILRKINLKKKYGIFLQNMYCYKFNLLNEYESPWEGTRICKKKDLSSIDFIRQKIIKKNLSQPFWKFYKEKSIEIFDDGGWHFNSLLTPEEISLKLKTFAHTEFAKPEYSNLEIIKKNIEQKKDLFKRNHEYKKVDLDNTYPKYILNNKEKLNYWIL